MLELSAHQPLTLRTEPDSPVIHVDNKGTAADDAVRALELGAQLLRHARRSACEELRLALAQHG